MPLTRTLAQQREAVERTANIRAFTDRHPATYTNDLINRGWGALQRVTAIVDPEFRPIASTTITTDGDATEYALPSNCRSILAVEYVVSGERTWLTPYDLPERAGLAHSNTTANATRATHYRRLGTNLELLPLADADHEAFVWYATTAIQLSADGDTADVFDRLDDYVVWWAAREIAMERDDWDRHDRLDNKIVRMEDQIMILARSRDLSGPAKVVDLRQADGYGRPRYR